MPFDWREYVVLAKNIANRNAGYSLEAGLRCSVSRAYYGAFCHARNYAISQLSYIAFKTSKDHAEVRKALLPSHPDVSASLKDLHIWRKCCDYEDFVSNISAMNSSAISEAESVVVKLIIP